MIRSRQFLSLRRPVAAFACFVAVATFGTSCRVATPPCAEGPLVDTTGEAAERARIDRQWLAIQGKLDSSSSTQAGIRAERSMQGSLDSSIARYRDSIRLDGRSIVSRSGCLDWRATWNVGRIDRTALATTWLRALVADDVGVVEWSVADTASEPLRLRVDFTRPGSDGGSLDAVELAIAPERVELAGPATR